MVRVSSVDDSSVDVSVALSSVCSVAVDEQKKGLLYVRNMNDPAVYLKIILVIFAHSLQIFTFTCLSLSFMIVVNNALIFLSSSGLTNS